MLYVAIYILGFIITVPLMGRWLYDDGVVNPGDITPATYAVLSGLVWPLVAILVPFFYFSKYMDTIRRVSRKAITGHYEYAGDYRKC